MELVLMGVMQEQYKKHGNNWCPLCKDKLSLVKSITIVEEWKKCDRDWSLWNGKSKRKTTIYKCTKCNKIVDITVEKQKSGEWKEEFGL